MGSSLRKSTQKAVVSAIIISASCLMLLELSMIVLEPYLFRGFYQYDAEMGFRVRPYANGTNLFGFNDADYPLKRDPDIFRILIVGDSFGWAGGLERNYTALLERKLESYYGRHKVDVINSGYPMTRTAEQLKMVRRYGLQYEPDLVILGFFAGNDFYDADPNRKRIVLNDTYFDIDPRYELRVLGYPIVPASRLLQFAKQRYRTWREVVGNLHSPRTTETPRTPEPHGTFSEETFMRIKRARLEFCNLSRHQAGEFDERIQYAFRAISDMKVLLDARNIHFVVGIYPDEFQVSEDLLNQIVEKFNLSRQAYDVECMQKLLRDYFAAQGIAYLDLLEDFRKRGREQPLYLFRGTHWNRVGNQLAADILFRYLLHEQLVKLNREP